MNNIIVLLTISIFSIMNNLDAQTNSSPFAEFDSKTAEALTHFYRFFETGDGDLLSASTSKELKDHDRNPMAEGTDYEALLTLGQSVQGLSNMTHHFTEVLKQADGRIVVRWEGKALHSGEAFGIAATQRTVYFNGHDIIRLEDGKVVELWHIEQLLQLTMQIK